MGYSAAFIISFLRFFRVFFVICVFFTELYLHVLLFLFVHIQIFVLWFWPAGLFHYTSFGGFVHRLTFFEPRDYRVVFVIQKTITLLRVLLFSFLYRGNRTREGLSVKKTLRWSVFSEERWGGYRTQRVGSPSQVLWNSTRFPDGSPKKKKHSFECFFFF